LRSVQNVDNKLFSENTFDFNKLLFPDSRSVVNAEYFLNYTTSVLRIDYD